MINCPTGMAIDIKTRRPLLANITGGLSGPAIKPIALRMVWQVHTANLGLPLVGIGGITTATDAIEFFLAGASAVQVGSASFVDPEASVKVVRGIRQYCMEQRIQSVSDLVGALKT
jgi:dihydroorotate dehydrogenase (NAD+) catalytic subunit